MKREMGKEGIVLFDLDGTLIDSTQAIYESFCAAYRACGEIPPSKEQVFKSIGHTLGEMFRQNGVRAERVDEYIQAYRIAYRENMEQGTCLLPLAKEAIVCASEFATLGVVTTKRGDFSRLLLESLGVAEYFKVIIGIESVSKPKPDKEPILLALSELKALGFSAPKERTFMVGDTRLDLQAAKSAGVNGVGVLCGFGKMGDLETFGTPLFAHAHGAVEHIKARLFG